MYAVHCVCDNECTCVGVVGCGVLWIGENKF